MSTTVILPRAQGTNGVTPQFSIGTVGTGAPAAVTQTGTLENPVLNFVLPTGDGGAIPPFPISYTTGLQTALDAKVNRNGSNVLANEFRNNVGLGFIITPDMFMTAGESYAATGADDAPAIQAANDFAESVGGSVTFPSELYGIKTPVKQSVPWAGANTRVRFRVDAAFAPDANGAAVYNKNFALAYDATTADEVDMTFFNLEHAATVQCATVKVANVKNLRWAFLTGDTFTTTICDPILDIFAVVKNGMVEHCHLKNSTNADVGGAMWVRNRIALELTDETQSTENIVVRFCSFGQTTKDEAYSVFGSRGLVKNVLTFQCRFYNITGGQVRSHIASTFGKIAETGAVRNIVFDGCEIEDDSFTFAGFRAGTAIDTTSTLSQVKFINAKLKVGMSNTTISSRSCVNAVAGLDVVFDNIDIDANFSTYEFAAGVLGAAALTNSKVSGKIASGTQSCLEVTGCEIDITGTVGVRCETTNVYDIRANRINMRNNSAVTYGVQFNTAGGATAPSGQVVSNKIAQAFASARPVFIGAPVAGTVRVADNSSTGLGSPTLPGITEYDLLECRGNVWFGVPDPIATPKTVSDASITLVAKADQIIRFNGTLTADRTFTLPTVGVKDGQRVTIWRDAVGAFKITGSSQTLTASGSALTFVYQGGWRLVSRIFPTLPVYEDNAAAVTGGLNVGDPYRTSTGVQMVRY